MKSCISVFFNKAVTRLCTQLVSVLFFILPVRVTEAFIQLSFFSLRNNKKGSDDQLSRDLSKLNKLLNEHYTEEETRLPSYTVSWIWPEQIDDVSSVKELHIDSEAIVRKFYKRSPYLLQQKLRMSGGRREERLIGKLRLLLDEGLGGTNLLYREA